MEIADMTRWLLVAVACAGPLALSNGCARAALDTTGFAVVESAEFDAPFMDAWQAAKAELRAMDLEIYTRDKRGVFVAFTPQGRALWLQPQRSKFTVTLEERRPGRTAVDVETTGQVYGVTLLTYPDWHERPARETDTARAILDGIAMRLGAEPPVRALDLDEAPAELTPEVPLEPGPPAEIEAEPATS
jgi:hypothetical protein